MCLAFGGRGCPFYRWAHRGGEVTQPGHHYSHQPPPCPQSPNRAPPPAVAWALVCAPCASRAVCGFSVCGTRQPQEPGCRHTPGGGRTCCPVSRPVRSGCAQSGDTRRISLDVGGGRKMILLGRVCFYLKLFPGRVLAGAPSLWRATGGPAPGSRAPFLRSIPSNTRWHHRGWVTPRMPQEESPGRGSRGSHAAWCPGWLGLLSQLVGLCCSPCSRSASACAVWAAALLSWLPVISAAG